MPQDADRLSNARHKGDVLEGVDLVRDGAPEIAREAPVKVQAGATATTGDLQDAGMSEAREEGLLYSLSYNGSCVGQLEKRPPS